MKPVAIRGLGLACALGLDAPACHQALALGSLHTVPVDLDGFAEPLHFPYYRIPDGSELFDPARLPRLVKQVVLEACASLSPTERATLPVYVGSTSFGITWAETEFRERLLKDPQAALGLPDSGYDSIAQVALETLGSAGPDFTFNTACTAAANALLAGARAVALGHQPRALVLGVEMANRTTLAGFAGLQLLGADLRPFDAARGGLVLGEGVGAILLEAAGPGDRFRLLGGACRSDLFSVTTANPDGSSIARVQAEALADAGVAASTILGVKAHGTASPMNDTGEAAGIKACFAAVPRVCGLKGLIGHTLGACGVLELGLMMGALQRGAFPATAQFQTADPALGLEPTRRETPAAPGPYLLDYFGFGGNNTSLVLELRP